MQNKTIIRKQILEKRNSLKPHILNSARIEAARRLASMKEFIEAKTVMVYMDFRNEVPTGEIIEKIRSTGKKLVLPFTDRDFNIIPFEVPEDGEVAGYLATSAFGIAEPDPELCRKADPGAIDLIIIPGSAFDQYENRIGYGKGCYDRFLAALPSSAFKLALAYDFQVLPCIPTDPADVKMDKILIIGTANVVKI